MQGVNYDSEIDGIAKFFLLNKLKSHAQNRGVYTEERSITPL